MVARTPKAGYPVIQLMTLCETGTRALIGGVFGATADGEITWARRLLHRLDDTMLMLVDRGFDAWTFLAEVAPPIIPLTRHNRRGRYRQRHTPRLWE
jgi:hypothetical protein